MRIRTSLRVYVADADDDSRDLVSGHGRLVGCPTQVVWAPGKSAQRVVQLMQEAQHAGRVCMVSRVEPDMFAHIRRRMPHARYAAPRLAPSAPGWCALGLPCVGGMEMRLCVKEPPSNTPPGPAAISRSVPSLVLGNQTSERALLALRAWSRARGGAADSCRTTVPWVSARLCTPLLGPLAPSPY